MKMNVKNILLLLKDSHKLNLMMCFALIVTAISLFFSSEAGMKIRTITDVQQGKINSTEIIKSEDNIYLFSPAGAIGRVERAKLAGGGEQLKGSENLLYFNHTNQNGFGSNAIFHDVAGSSFYQVINRINGEGVFSGEYYLAAYSGDFKLQKVSLLLKSDHLERLRATHVKIRGINFYQPLLLDNSQDMPSVERYGNGYRLVISLQLFDRLKQYPLEHNDDKKYFYHLAHVLRNECKGRNSFLPADVLKIINFFSAKTFWQQQLECGETFAIASLHQGRVIGLLDCETASDCLLIQLAGGKYLADRLLCFSRKENRIIWQKTLLKNISQIEIIDTDLDGRREIVAACSPFTATPDLDYFSDYDNSGTSSFPELAVLHLPAAEKQQSGSEHYYRIGGNCKENTVPRFRYLPSLQIILAGTDSEEGGSVADSLRILNLANGEMSVTDIECSGVKYIDVDDGKISVLENSKGNLLKNDYIFGAFDRKLKKTGSSKFTSFFEDGRILFPRPDLEIEGRCYFISDPLAIMNENLETLLKTEYSLRSLVKSGSNSLLATCTTYDSASGFGESVKKIELEQFYNFPSGLLTLFVGEVLLLLFFNLFRFSKTLPHLSTDNNLLVLYSFPGSLNIIRSSAAVKRLFHLPGGVCKGVECFYECMENIDRKAYFERAANFGIYSYTVYKLESIDENDIIKRISHDLKNSLLDLTLTTDLVFRGGVEDAAGKQGKLYGNVSELIGQISGASVKLSRFISLLGNVKKDSDLSDIVMKIYFSFIHHPSFELLEVDPRFKEKSGIMVDGRIMAEIVRILLHNSIEAQQQESGEVAAEKYKITIKLIASEGNGRSRLEISNVFRGDLADPDRLYDCGYSSQEEHTGTGLSIARNLAEIIDAEFEISLADQRFTAEIIL